MLRKPETGRQPMNCEVKICGITNVDDALIALEAGADYLGVVLYEKSPRAVSMQAVCRLRDCLPETARLVAVSVNAARQDLDRLVNDAGLYAVQLHGDEAAADWCDVSAYPLWRATAYQSGAWLPQAEQWPFVQRLVVDAAAPGVYGGSGSSADWHAASELAARRCCMLAGGLTPDNIAQAVLAVNPAGVDVSSGVEAAPGRKDSAKVREFIRHAKNAGKQ